jgi:hypothetical protein
MKFNITSLDKEYDCPGWVVQWINQHDLIRIVGDGWQDLPGDQKREKFVELAIKKGLTIFSFDGRDVWADLTPTPELSWFALKYGKNQ